MFSVHESGIKIQLAYFCKILTQRIRNLRYRVEPVFSGYPRGYRLKQVDRLIQVPHNRSIMENDRKTPSFAIIDHFVYKNSLKNTTNIDSGR